MSEPKFCRKRGRGLIERDDYRLNVREVACPLWFRWYGLFLGWRGHDLFFRRDFPPRYDRLHRGATMTGVDLCTCSASMVPHRPVPNVCPVR